MKVPFEKLIYSSFVNCGLFVALNFLLIHCRFLCLSNCSDYFLFEYDSIRTMSEFCDSVVSSLLKTQNLSQNWIPSIQNPFMPLYINNLLHGTFTFDNAAKVNGHRQRPSNTRKWDAESPARNRTGDEIYFCGGPWSRARVVSVG